MSKIKRYVWLFLFAVAFGYLEASVVIYLRELYCPGGFLFPLKMPPVSIYLIELGREISTIVMLAGIAIIVGSTGTKLAYFFLLFGIWDIFFYFWLYLITGWPSSLFTWDILFSIPVSWAAPVIAPLLVSLLLIGYSIMILYLDVRGYKIKISFLEKAGGLLGLFLIFLSMTIDAFPEPKIYLSRAPISFHWGLFVSGVLLSLIVMGRLLVRRDTHWN